MHTVSRRMTITITKKTKAGAFVHMLCPITKIESLWLNDKYLEWSEYTYNSQFISIPLVLNPGDVILIEYTD